MIPRSAAEGQEVNSRNADEVFTEDGGDHALCDFRDLPLSGTPNVEVGRVVVE